MTPYGHRWRTVTTPRIRRRDGGRCRFCGAPDVLRRVRSRAGRVYARWSHGVAHLRIPPGEPGHDADHNLALLCAACHVTFDLPVASARARETRVARKDAARLLLAL